MTLSRHLRAVACAEWYYQSEKGVHMPFVIEVQTPRRSFQTTVEDLARVAALIRSARETPGYCVTSIADAQTGALLTERDVDDHLFREGRW